MTTVPEDNWEMLTEESSAALTISFVIAVALYVVTYLSFVRLLRYGVPREIVLPTSTIAFLDGNIAGPYKPKEYLRLIYGDFGEVVYTYVDAAAAKTRCRADTAERAVDPTCGSR